LQACDALAVLIPELQWDSAARRALQRAVALSPEAIVRFAALQAASPPEAITSLCERLRVPVEYRELALLAARLAPRLLQAHRADAEEMLALLETADAVRRPERFARLLLVARARADSASEPPGELWSQALATAAGITLAPGEFAALSGPQIAAALRARRLEALAPLLRAHSERRRS
jgi:tRNA nucleotidyltransferase (CCA-adding enzyme)